MTEYDNTNRGTLFTNDRKQTDKHADYTGKLNVGGKDYWISAWTKKTKRGDSFLSISVKPQAPATDWEDAGSGKAKILPPDQSISQRAMPKRPDPISSGRHLPPKGHNILPDDDMDGDTIPF